MGSFTSSRLTSYVLPTASLFFPRHLPPLTCLQPQPYPQLCKLPALFWSHHKPQLSARRNCLLTAALALDNTALPRSPLHMPIMAATSKSRVRFPRRLKRKQQDKTEATHKKQTKASEGDQKQRGETNTKVTSAKAQTNLVDKQIMPGNDTSSKPAQHEEESTRYSYKNFPFFKRRVLSTEEAERRGFFRSLLSTIFGKKLIFPSVGSDCAIEDDSDDEPSDSPPASLILSAPVYREVNGQLEEQFSARPVTEQPVSEATTAKSSSRSWIKNLLNIFAGRRKSGSKRHAIRRHARCSPAAVPLVTPTEPINVSSASRDQSECGNTPPLTPPTPPGPPRLTHRQVVPPITRGEGDGPSRHPGFVHIPSAPVHKTIGANLVFEDAAQASNVQRGFHVPNLPEAPPAPVEQHTNNSARNLLDRDEDVWARWHAKYPNREDHPFAQQVPSSSF